MCLLTLQEFGKPKRKNKNGESPIYELVKPQAFAQVPTARAYEMENAPKAFWTCLEGGGVGIHFYNPST